jgi:hypothetical protein
LLFTQTCTDNKGSSNNPEGSFVNSHKSSTLPEAGLRIAAFLTDFAKKWEQNMKRFSTAQKFAGFQEDKS